MAICNMQLTRDHNTCSRQFSFVASSLAVQCLGVQCRLRHSPSDRYKDCSTQLCLPLHPQRPVCLEPEYHLYKSLLLKQKASQNLHWSYLSFNLRNVITPVNIWKIEICERTLDWKAIELEKGQAKNWKGKKRVCFKFCYCVKCVVITTAGWL